MSAEPSKREEDVSPRPTPSVLARAFVWSIPLVNVAIAIVAQLAIPRLLQLGLTERDYTAYVAITSVAAYVGLGEGGILVSLLRELSARHGAGDKAAFLAELRRARTLFVLASCIGGALSVGAFLTQRATFAEHGPVFLVGGALLIVAMMLDLVLGGLQGALLFATGRYLLGQLGSMAMVVVPLVALVVALVFGKSLTAAVWAQAGASLLVSLVRGVHGYRVFRAEAQGVTGDASTSPLLTVVGPGAALKLSEVMQTASYPHLLSVMAPWVVPSAIPARTYANATKLVTQQFVNLLQVHVTRGLAGDSDARAKARSNYRLAATFLTSSQLFQLGVAAGLASVVFSVWLPNQTPYVRELLPGLLAWQALLAACLPADILFVAAGHLRLLGIARIVATAVGLAVVALVLGSTGRGALGIGLAVSALPLFAFGLWGELSLLREVAPARGAVLARYALAAIGALGCASFGRWPWLSAIVSCGVALVGLPRSALELWKLLRSR